MTFNLPGEAAPSLQEATAQGPQQVWSVLQQYGVPGEPTITYNNQPVNAPVPPPPAQPAPSGREAKTWKGGGIYLFGVRA